MKEITLGKTGIKTPQNAFGALPIQRVTMDEAVKEFCRRAYEGGMTFLILQELTVTARRSWDRRLRE